MIRKMKAGDTEQVAKIWLEGNLDAHDFIPEKYWKAHLQEVKRQFLQADVYVYEANGTIRGFAGMQNDYLAGIFVEKPFRSEGIGRKLLDYVKSIHRRLLLNVYRKNERAVKFYLREGFVIILEGTDRNTGETDYAMSWSVQN